MAEVNSATHANLGLFYFKKKLYDKALFELETAIRMDPGNRRALVNHGIVMQTVGKYSDAVNSFKSALKLDPRDTTARKNLGMTYLVSGMHSQAVIELSNALSLQPKDTQIMQNLAMANVYSGNYNNALKLVKRILSITPKSADAYNTLGMVYSRSGRIDEAIHAYRQSIAIQPANIMAHNNLGLVFRKLGREDEAIAEYLETVRIKPDNAAAHNNLGVLFFRKKDFDSALDHLRTGTELDPDNQATKNNLLKLYQYLLERYRKILAAEPDNAAIHARLGDIERKLGRLDDALNHFKQANRINPDLPGLAQKFGQTLLDRGMEAEAEKVFRTATIGSDTAQVRIALGKIHYQRGEYSEAISQFKEAIALDPEDPDAHYHLSFAYGDKGLMDEALAESRKAIELNPGFVMAHTRKSVEIGSDIHDYEIVGIEKDDHLDTGTARAHLNVGLAFRKKKDLKRAVTEFENAISVYPDDVEAMYYLALTNRDLGRIDDALDAINRILAIKPGYKAALTLQQNIRKQAAGVVGSGSKRDVGNVPDKNVWESHRPAASENGPGSAEHVAMIHSKTGNHDKAIETLKKAVAADKNNDQLYLDLGKAYLAAGQHDQAIRTLYRALTVKSRFAEAHEYLAQAYCGKKWWNEAIVEFTHALDIHSDYPDAVLGMATAYERKGWWAEAIRSWQKFLELEPDGARSENVRRSIREIAEWGDNLDHSALPPEMKK